MRRSKLMLAVAVLGLALGIPLALKGWEGLRGVLIFLEAQSPRLLGSILVGLSIAVFVRQARAHSAAPPQPPGVSQTPHTAPQGDGATSQPEYFRRLEFEHELIGRRIGWLLTSQTILLAAYGFSLGKEMPQAAAPFFQRLIPIVGLSVSVTVLFGVFAGVLAKYHTWKDFEQTEWGIRTHVTYIGLVPDFALPVIFALVWGVLV